MDDNNPQPMDKGSTALLIVLVGVAAFAIGIAVGTLHERGYSSDEITEFFTHVLSGKRAAMVITEAEKILRESEFLS